MAEILLLQPSLISAYESFLNTGRGLLFHSNKYRLMLKEVLNAEDYYFLYRDGDRILGALPCFLKQNKQGGNVLNSLPFFGSHGGMVEFENNLTIRRALLSRFEEFAKEKECLSATMVQSPWDTSGFLEKEFQWTHKVERIGQVTDLPALETGLMDQFHSKTRNMIRKAMKNGVTVSLEPRLEWLSFLADAHRQNAIAIDIVPKPPSFFESLPKVFQHGSDFRIFTALLRNKPVASLLLFYYNGKVDYYVPAVLEEFRSIQPLSLLVYEAMRNAVAEGYRQWNWGGTAPEAQGVYHFKNRWGSRDLPYCYYNRIYDERVYGIRKEILLNEYQYFFVVPFDHLKTS